MHLGRIRGFSGFITTSHFKAKPSVGIWNSDPEVSVGSKFVLKMVLLSNTETSSAHIRATTATRRNFHIN